MKVPGWIKIASGLVIAMLLVIAWTNFQLGEDAPKLEEKLQTLKTEFSLPLVLEPQKTFELSSLKGQNLAVNFWASWCEPCKAEFPSMIEFLDRFPDFKIVAVSVDEDEQAMLEFLRSYKIPKNFILLRNLDRKIADQYGTYKLPETFILDRNLRPIRKLSGAHNWTGSEFMGFINSLNNSK